MAYKKIACIGFVFLLLTGCSQQKLYTERAFIMGTVVEVTSPYPEASKIAFKEMQRVENVFSQYLPDSAISHLNKTGFLNSNYEIVSLLKYAKEFYSITNKRFDVSVGSVSRLWKTAFADKKLPSEAEIKDALKSVGFKNIYFDEKNNIKLKKPGIELDFGAIAKGYAIDAAVKELLRNGIDSAIVNASGNMYCIGTRFGRPWKIGVRDPRGQALMGGLELKDIAVASSGDYEQYVFSNGKRYSHIVDPLTGYPVDTDVASVTVVAKSAMLADAVGTCIFLLGKDEGTRIFKNFEGVEKIIVITKKELGEK